MKQDSIRKISARPILTTGAYPTIETTVQLESGAVGVASCPRGSSEGVHEPVFLTDGNPREFGGRGVNTAVENVNRLVDEHLRGMEAVDQFGVDAALAKLDGTPNCGRLGVNSILSTSIAVARAYAAHAGIQLHSYLHDLYSRLDPSAPSPMLPRPMVVMIEGGAHADKSTDLQEYLALAERVSEPWDTIASTAELYHAIGKLVKASGRAVNVGFEGAYAFSNANSNVEPAGIIKDAISSDSKFSRFALGLDAAASEFYDEKTSGYHLKLEGGSYSASRLADLYSTLIRDFGLISLEDPFAEDAWDHWREFFPRFESHVPVIGDDLTASDPERIRRAFVEKCINAIILKPNQAGSLTRTLEAAAVCRKHKGLLVVSHRGGGETNDTFIVDLAVALASDYLKCGISRGERVSKYNHLVDLAIRHPNTVPARDSRPSMMTSS